MGELTDNRNNKGTSGEVAVKQTARTASNPFGPWMLPAYERCRQQLMQARMNKKAQPSQANQRMNSQINERRHRQQRANLDADGSSKFVFGSVNTY